MLAKYCRDPVVGAGGISIPTRSPVDSEASTVASCSQLSVNPPPLLCPSAHGRTWKRSGVTVQLLPPMATATSQGRGPCCSCGGVVKRTAPLLTYVPSTIVSPRGEVRRTRTLPSLKAEVVAGEACGSRLDTRCGVPYPRNCYPSALRSTPTPHLKRRPEMVTSVPPATGPMPGEMPRQA